MRDQHRITVTARGRYRDAVTTIRATLARDTAGRRYLSVSARQLREAGNRCCYAGDDAPRLTRIVGFGEWQPAAEGGAIARGNHA